MWIRETAPSDSFFISKCFLKWSKSLFAYNTAYTKKIHVPGQMMTCNMPCLSPSLAFKNTGLPQRVPEAKTFLLPTHFKLIFMFRWENFVWFTVVSLIRKHDVREKLWVEFERWVTEFLLIWLCYLELRPAASPA